MNLHGNTVLITGGSRGIGLALAEAFLAAGSTVAICGRDAARLRAVQARHPGVLARACDLAVERSRLRLAEWAAQALPALNVLVNNAGVQRELDFTGGLGEFLQGENEIRVDLEAPILLSGLLIPQLRANAPAAIINVTCGLAFAPHARMPVYCAAKAGLHAWSVALRRQLEPAGVQVFELAPPAVDTGLDPRGRPRPGGAQAGLGAREFVASVMHDLEADRPEIGYGATWAYLRASRAGPDSAFTRADGGRD